MSSRKPSAVKVRFLDEITENALRSYKKFMIEQGTAGKTIDTRLNIVFFLLNGIAARIPETRCPSSSKKLLCRMRTRN